MQNPQQHLERYLPLHLLGTGAKVAHTVFAFSLDGISLIGRAIIDQAIAQPWLFGITAALIVGGILFLILPAIVGFGPLGPIAGSFAAQWQGWIGNVVAGSLFSVLQKCAMIGVFNNIGAAMIASGVAGAGVGAALQSPVGKKFTDAAEMMVRAADFAAMYGYDYARGIDYAGGVEDVKAKAGLLAKQLGFLGHKYYAGEATEMMAKAKDFAAHYGFK